MQSLHVHEILRKIQSLDKTFGSKEEFSSWIKDNFGENTTFFACSAENLSHKDIYEFLIFKEKIVDQNGRISIAPQMSMCDGG